MNESVIVVENLTRRFGEFVAVDHINFEIEAGEVVGYLGPNGSGKTTTIRMLLGLLQPSDGRATVLGYDAFNQSEEVRARAGYMSQKFALYDELTVWENLMFYGGVYGISEKVASERRSKRSASPIMILRWRVRSLPVGVNNSHWQSPWCINRNCYFWMNPLPALTRPRAAHFGI